MQLLIKNNQQEKIPSIIKIIPSSPFKNNLLISLKKDSITFFFNYKPNKDNKNK